MFRWNILEILDLLALHKREIAVPVRLKSHSGMAQNPFSEFHVIRGIVALLVRSQSDEHQFVVVSEARSCAKSDKSLKLPKKSLH